MRGRKQSLIEFIQKIVLTGIIPLQPAAASTTTTTSHFHHLHQLHHQLSMINDSGLQHPSSTSPAVPSSTSSSPSSSGGGGVGGIGGHNINSIMTPPDAHLNSSAAYNTNPEEIKYSLVSTLLVIVCKDIFSCHYFLWVDFATLSEQYQPMLLLNKWNRSGVRHRLNEFENVFKNKFLLM